ncbi:ARM repeat-containing protein [Terfezia boudieri ATCC MYA-4762]|uniref:ARM repeat-containing protein n=1 Tax=Terfezia boudieri ATCC MYA-4762 TaxID=1051890 RepID=A0A3N4LFV8_9PEZI|nr:ARM repeat-containing protein [Terfezia boudieri ATCC MYA-4762]
MEQEVLRLLTDLQASEEVPRRNAEAQLENLQSHHSFPIALINVANEQSLTLSYRTQSLLILKNWVLSCWSPHFEDYKGSKKQAPEEVKQEVRNRIFPLITNDERKIRTTSAYVMSKIASSDYPDEWPSLLPSLLNLINNGNNNEAHGALRVLSDVIEDSFSDEQFFRVARELVDILFRTASNEARPHNLKAIAVSGFRSCLEILEMMKSDYEQDVRSFLSDALAAWVPFFVQVVDIPLLQSPEQQFQGLVTLKIQVIRTLMKIRFEFAPLLNDYMRVLFQSTWNELNQLKDRYVQEFIENDTEGRLVDVDHLPYSLDLFILEELDFVQLCLKAKSIKDAIVSQQGGPSGPSIEHLIYATICLAQITVEDEGLWDIDQNIFLCEETSATANYSPRTACGDLILKLADWLPEATATTLWGFTQQIFNTGNRKVQESILYVWDQVLSEWSESDVSLDPNIAAGLVHFIAKAISSTESGHVFLRARGYLLAGTLAKDSVTILGDQCKVFLEQTIQASTQDPDGVVQISCLKVLQKFCESLPSKMVAPYQKSIISAIAEFINNNPQGEPEDSQDILATLTETLRSAIGLNHRIIVEPESRVVDLLFTIANLGEGNLYLAGLISDGFEEFCEELYNDFIPLCEKVLPQILAALDKGVHDKDSPLTSFAANLLSLLVQNGAEPLPNGFVAQVVPRVARLLLTSTDSELLQAGCEALKHTVHHDPKQVQEWRDETGKSGLEIVLMIIDRLLGPTTTDNMALEVGGLAAEVVDTLSEHLGPYLEGLLRAVANRLQLATTTPMIQSLILVFARLTIRQAKEVVTFLAGINVGELSGLQSVLTKWLTNSEYFSGYSEIRENVIALSRLFTLDDPRLKAIIVQGDMIVDPQQYTQIPVPLKIIKLLIKELIPVADAAAVQQGINAAGSVVGDSDDEWEDLEDIGIPRKDLMALEEEGSGRQSRIRDDETNVFLIQFFKDIYNDNIGGFREMVPLLTEDERYQLSLLGGQS